MYINYDALLPDVVQGLLNEGVEEASFNKNRALYAIQQSYRNLVNKSHSMRRVISIPTQAGVSEYHLFKYDGHVITKIYNVDVEYPCDVWMCHKKGSICSCNCCDGTFGYNDGFVSICPAPDCDGMSMELCVSLAPESGDCQMDERIYELYRDYIVAGAISRLLSKRDGRPYLEEYTIGIDEAESDASAQWSKRFSDKRRSKWFRR